MRTGTSTPKSLGKTGAAVIEADVANFVVGAHGLGDVELLDAFAGHDASLVFALPEIEQATKFLGELAAAGINHDNGNACSNRVLDGFAEGRRIGNGNHEAIRLRGNRCINHLGHLGHVKGFGRQIFGFHAERLGGIIHAVLDDGPIGIAALAMGHKHNTGFIERQQIRQPPTALSAQPEGRARVSLFSQARTCFLLLNISASRDRGQRTSCIFSF